MIFRRKCVVLVEFYRDHWTWFQLVVCVFQSISIDVTMIFQAQDGRGINYYKADYTHNFNSFAQIMLNI